MDGTSNDNISLANAEDTMRHLPTLQLTNDGFTGSLTGNIFFETTATLKCVLGYF